MRLAASRRFFDYCVLCHNNRAIMRNAQDLIMIAILSKLIGFHWRQYKSRLLNFDLVIYVTKPMSEGDVSDES
jgi:hypothetical protein